MIELLGLLVKGDNLVDESRYKFIKDLDTLKFLKMIILFRKIVKIVHRYESD